MVTEYGFPESSFAEKTGFKNWLRSQFTQASYTFADLRSIRGCVYHFNASAKVDWYKYEFAFVIANRREDGQFEVRIETNGVSTNIERGFSCGVAPEKPIFPYDHKIVCSEDQLFDIIMAEEHSLELAIKSDYERRVYPKNGNDTVKGTIHYSKANLLRSDAVIPASDMIPRGYELHH